MCGLYQIFSVVLAQIIIDTQESSVTILYRLMLKRGEMIGQIRVARHRGLTVTGTATGVWTEGVGFLVIRRKLHSFKTYQELGWLL